MTCLPEYDELKAIFDYYDHVIPPTDHTQYEDAYNAYKKYGNVLLLHLLKHSKIPSNLAPLIAIKQQDNSMATCEFKMLFDIINLMIQELGG